MLSRHHRLRREGDIQAVFRRGKGFHSPFFSVKYLARTDGTHTRLAFSFSKKYLLRAVRRNRLKRLIIGELQKSPEFFLLGLDAVFFLTKPSVLRDKNELRKCVENFLKTVYTKGKTAH